MALGYRVRSHRVGICEFILLYLCLFGWINKPYKRGNCNLYGFIPFIFSRAQLVLIAWCSVQLCTKHGCDCVVPNWECPFGGAMFLHLEARRFYSHNDGVIFQELLSRCDLLTGTFKVVNPNLCTNHVHSFLHVRWNMPVPWQSVFERIRLWLISVQYPSSFYPNAVPSCVHLLRCYTQVLRHGQEAFDAIQVVIFHGHRQVQPWWSTKAVQMMQNCTHIQWSRCAILLLYYFM